MEMVKTIPYTVEARSHLGKSLVDPLRPIIDGDETIGSEYHNASFRFTFGRLFNAAISAAQSSCKREADCMAALTELIEDDPDIMNRKTRYAADNLEKAQKVHAVADEIANAFEEAHTVLTGSPFDAVAYRDAFDDTPKETPKQIKARKDRVAALLG